MGSSDNVLAKTFLCPPWNITVLRACCVLPFAATLDSAGRMIHTWSSFGISCNITSLIITTISTIFIYQNSSTPWYQQQPTFVNFLAQITLVLYVLSTILSTLVFLLKRESWIRFIDHLLIADSVLSNWDQVPNNSSNIAIFHICSFLVNTACILLGFHQQELDITFGPAVWVSLVWGGLINDATLTILLIILQSIAKRFQRLNTVISKYRPLANNNFVWSDSKTGNFLSSRKRKHLHKVAVQQFSKTYESLLEASVTLNSYFSVLTPLSVLIIFMCNVVMTFILVSYAIGNQERIPVSFSVSIIVPGIIGILELTNLLRYCRWSCEEAARTSTYVHKLCNESGDDGLKIELLYFSKQLLKKSFKYSACGLFVLDYSLLYSFVCATSTYLIILMQSFL